MNRNRESAYPTIVSYLKHLFFQYTQKFYKFAVQVSEFCDSHLPRTSSSPVIPPTTKRSPINKFTLANCRFLVRNGIILSVRRWWPRWLTRAGLVQIDQIYGSCAIRTGHAAIAVGRFRRVGGFQSGFARWWRKRDCWPIHGHWKGQMSATVMMVPSMVVSMMMMMVLSRSTRLRERFGQRVLTTRVSSFGQSLA